jgi:hypothetical protein
LSFIFEDKNWVHFGRKKVKFGRNWRKISTGIKKGFHSVNLKALIILLPEGGVEAP